MKIIEKFLREVRSFKKKNSVKAIIKHNEFGILILKRQLDDAGAAMWDLPGGAIEDGESQENALKREAMEETGLSIKKITTKNLSIPEQGINSDMNIYICGTDAANVKLNPASWKGSKGKPEHIQYMWIKKNTELENLKMLDILKSVLKSYLE